MRKRQPSPLDVIEARVAQLAAALAVLAPKPPELPGPAVEPDQDPASGDAGALREPAPPANDLRSSGP